MSVDVAGSYSSQSLTVSNESWIGHPMDPIGCLFSVLLDAANITSSENRTGELYLCICMYMFHRHRAKEISRFY